MLRRAQKSVWREIIHHFFRKMAFRRVAILLKQHSGSCQSLVVKRRPKSFVLALCSADIILLWNQEGNSWFFVVVAGPPWALHSTLLFIPGSQGLSKNSARWGKRSRRSLGTVTVWTAWGGSWQTQVSAFQQLLLWSGGVGFPRERTNNNCQFSD